MSNREIARLACKFLAVYIIVFALVAIPNVLVMLNPGGSFGATDAEWKNYQLLQTIALAGTVLLRLAFGIVLWFAADKLSIKFSANYEDAPSSPSQVDSKSYMVVGLGLIGAYLAAYGLVSILSAYINLFATPDSSQVSLGMRLLGPILSKGQSDNTVELIIGLILLFKSPWLVSKLKSYPVSTEEKPVEVVGHEK